MAETVDAAAVTAVFMFDEAQLARVQRRAAELDRLNLGSTDAPEEYSPALAFARVLASDPDVVGALIPKFTDGYTTEVA